MYICRVVYTVLLCTCINIYMKTSILEYIDHNENM